MKDNHLLSLSVIVGSCPCLSGMYVCVRARERETERERDGEAEGRVVSIQMGRRH